MKKFQSLLRVATRKEFIQSAFKLPLRTYSTDSESTIEDKLKADPKSAAMELFLRMNKKVGRRKHEWPIVKVFRISNLLSTIYTNYTDFCAESTFGLEYYDMLVDGENMGPIHDLNVNALIAKSVVSPFGLGTETVIDENVRKAREITADRITFVSEHERKTVEEQIQYQAYRYGVMKPFQKPTIKLHKLCIYETGGFFKTHTDSLHADNHVGSAVVVFPNPHEGGELVVRKGKHEAICSPKNKDYCYLFSFFTDCEHEVRPVTSGCRISLQFDIFCDKAQRFARVERKGKDIDEDDEEYDEEYEEEEEDGDECINYIEYEPFPHSCEQPYKESLNFHSKFDPKSVKQELIDAITNHLSSDGPLALMLYHRYQRLDMNPSILKGVDYEIWNMLHDTFDMSCQSITINTSEDPHSRDRCDTVEPFDYNTAVLDKEYSGTSYNVIDAVDSCCTLNLLHFQHGAEHVGNNSMDEESTYFGAVILINKVLNNGEK